MKTAAIALDEWKLSIFEKHLTAAGYAFTRHPGIVAGTRTLKVALHESEFAALTQVIADAQIECASQAGGTKH